MTEDTKNTAGEQEHPHQAQVDEAEASTAADAPAVQDEAAVWKDKYLRLMADMENLRKRTTREVEDARKYAVASFARELLNVQDNMERALSTMKAEAADPATTLKAVIEGVSMVAQQLTSAFDKAQIKKMESPVGQKVDPERHQAMFEVPTDDHDHGTIVQEMQAGYMIGDRLLRPALVGTAKRTSSDKSNPPPQDGTNG